MTDKNGTPSAEFMAERERVIREAMAILREAYENLLMERAAEMSKEVQSEQLAA